MKVECLTNSVTTSKEEEVVYFIVVQDVVIGIEEVTKGRVPVVLLVKLVGCILQTLGSGCTFESLMLSGVCVNLSFFQCYSELEGLDGLLA